MDVDLRQKEAQIKEKELEYLESLLTDHKIQTFHDRKYMDHIGLNHNGTFEYECFYQ